MNSLTSTPEHVNEKTELGLDLVQQTPVDDIVTVRQNEKSYRPVTADDPDIINLAISIRDSGVLEPLVATSDGWLLSGHRRHAAALRAGLQTVLCVVFARRVDERQHFRALLTA